MFVKNELGKNLLELRLSHINGTHMQKLLDDIEHHDQFPVLHRSSVEQTIREKYFNKVLKTVQIYEDLKRFKITLIKDGDELENLMENEPNKSVLLLIDKFDNYEMSVRFQHIRRYYKHNDNLICAINSEIFDKNQTESKPRISLYSKGVLDIDNYEDIHHQFNEELNKLNMPTGFIYAQLNYHDHPQRYWPNNIWQEVSEQYAGLFFRVIGGNSRALDRTQDQSYPGLVIENSVKLSMKVHNKINITIIPGQWSDYVRTGGTYQNKKRIGLSFHVTNDEVRPKNTAIRIWKCLGDVKEKRLWSRERIKVQIFSTSMSMLN